MKTVFLFLVSLTFCQANTILYNTSVMLYGDANYRQFNAAGEISVPGFDSTLGTLDSIDYQFNVAGGLMLQTISQDAAHSLWFGTYIDTVYSFLGVTARHSEGDVFTRANSYGACGAVYQTVCSLPVTTIGLTDGSFYTYGAITNELSTAASYAGGPPVNNLAANLTPYIDAAQLLLPVSAFITVQPTGYSGLVIGDLMAPRTFFGLNWTYNYTPRPPVSPSVDPLGFDPLPEITQPELTAAPEPGVLVLLLAAIFAVVFLRKIFDNLI